MKHEIQGGCLCGAVRYRLRSEPFDAGYCHCATCRRATGAPVVAFATVPFADFLVSGSPRRRRSSEFGERWFCGECGSQLASRTAANQPVGETAIVRAKSPLTPRRRRKPFSRAAG